MDKLYKIIVYGGMQLVVLMILIGWNSRYLWGTIILATTISGVFLLAVIFQNKISSEEKQVPWLLLLFFLLLPVSLFFTSNLNNTLMALLKLLSCFMAFWLFYRFTNVKNKNQFLAIIFLTGLIASAYSIWEFFQYSSPATGIASFFGWRNTYAGFLVMVIPISLYFLFRKNGKVITALLVAGNTIILTSFFLTFSQAAWLSLGLALVFLLFVYFIRSDRKSLLIKTASLAVCTIIISSLLVAFHGKLNQPENGTAAGSGLREASQIAPIAVETRLAYWRNSWELFKESPVKGVGLGNFSDYYIKNLHQLWAITSSPHNYFILLGVEAGAVVGALFLAFLIQLYYSAGKKLFKLNNKWTDSPLLYYSLLASLSASLMHNLLDFDWEIPSLFILWWIILGIMLSLFPLKKIVLKKQLISEKNKYFIKIVLAAVALAGASSLTIADYYATKGSGNLKEFGQGAEAVKNYQKALVYNPFDPLYYEGLSRSWWDRVLSHDENREEYIMHSVAAAEKAVKLSPQSSHQRYFLAQVYYFTASSKNDHLEKSFFQINKAIELDWHDPDYYYLLAKLYQHQGDYQKAMEVCDAALSIYTEEEKKKIIFFWYINENLLEERLARIKALKHLLEEAIKAG